MKPRAVAAATVVMIAAALTTLTISGAAPASAATGDLSGMGQRAFAEVANCAANANVLLASIVVDESGSLRNTDPANRRVAGITTAIDTLADLRAAASDKLDVQANLSTFAAGYEQLVPWGSLDKAHADKLRTTAVTELPKRNQGQLTDYRQALRGAQQQLDQRASQVHGTACKVVLWFTDGGLDVGKSTNSAKSDLCSPHGLVDSLRGDGINVLAFALFTTAGSGSVTAPQREQLRAIVEGTGAKESCGSTPISSDSAAGAYLRADDANSLRRLFAGAGALISGGTQALAVDCPSNRCVNGRLVFPIDAGIAGLRLVVDAAGSQVPLQLMYPDGTRHTLAPGTSAVPGGSIQVKSRDGLTTVAMDFRSPSGPHVGGWAVLAVDKNQRPVPVTVDLYYIWGAGLTVTAPEHLVLGQTSPLNVTFTSSRGAQLSPALYKALQLRVTVAGVEVAMTRSGEDQFTGHVLLPTQKAATSVAVSATANALSAPNGLKLGPTSATVRLATALPASYPSLTPARLDLPAVMGAGNTTGFLTVNGSASGATRACVMGNTLSGPDGAGTLRVQAAKQCVDVPTNGQSRWGFTISPSAAADGRVTGNVQVALTAAHNAGTIEVSVPVGFTMSRPVNAPLRWALILGLIAGSLLIPLLFLYLANAWIGRYALQPLTLAAAAPIWLTPSGLTRRGPGNRLIEPDDFSSIGTSRPTKVKSFAAQGVTFGRTLSWWPTRGPQAVTSGAGPELVVSGIGNFTQAGGRRAPGNFGLASSWVLLIDPTSVTSEKASGRLVLVNDDSGLREIIAARIDQLHNFPWWEALWERVVALANQPSKEAPAAPRTDGAPPTRPDDSVAIPDRPPPPASWDGDPAPPPPSPGLARQPAGRTHADSPPAYDDAPPPPPNY
jgi:von Willebrand factor type A domain